MNTKILFHGSPLKLKILKPKKSKGFFYIENLKAVYLTPSFKEAALYAISKSLKGKTSFAITRQKLYLFGNYKLSKGYVYEVRLRKDDKYLRRIPLGYIYLKQIRPKKVHVVSPKDFENFIVRIKNKKKFNKLIKRLEKQKNETIYILQQKSLDNRKLQRFNESRKA